MQVSAEMARTSGSEAEEQIYEMQVRICKAFANPTRLHMLDLLSKREHSVSDLQGELVSCASLSLRNNNIQTWGI
jgi:hypothetical protein